MSYVLLFSQRRFDQQRHSNFVRANKRISGQFSHAYITWTKEECSFIPGLRYSPVDTCAYLFYLFLSFIFYFLFFLIFCLTRMARMARTMTRMARMARPMTRMARTMTRMARWLAC